MLVEVKFYAMLREASGKKQETYEIPEKSSVEELMDIVVSKYGERFNRCVYDGEKQVRDYLSFMLNGINVNSLKGFETILNDGDVLAILPPIGGG